MDQDLNEILYRLRHQQHAIVEGFAGPTCKIFWSDMRRTGPLYTLRDKDVLELNERWIGGRKTGIWITLTPLGQQLWKRIHDSPDWDDD